jgi:hypothetical protein
LNLVISGCKQKTTVLKSPPGYNLQEPTTVKLDLRIKEISGLEWDPIKNVFLTHVDESGKLFYLDRDTKQVLDEFKIAGKGDYEDIALVNNTPYMLRSDGLIMKVQSDSSGKPTSGEEMGKIELEGSVDFETMYYDSLRNALVILCKNCKIDDGKSRVSAFAYYLDSAKQGFDTTPLYSIDQKKVEELSPKKTSKLQPSAARIQPNLKKLFIISSAANLLVVTDLDGKVETVHWLKPKIFPQPEGLTFNRTGDMYISNEGVTSEATIHRFKATGDSKR